MTDNKFKLIKEIIELSESKIWLMAKEEWSLNYIEKIDLSDGEEPETCLCGHFPIIELCHIRNKINNREAVVGNVCVTKFMGINSDSLFTSIRRISSDNSKSISDELAIYAKDHGMLTDWEYKFCLDTKGKRKLSQKQMLKRVQINERLINSIKRKGV